MITYKEPMTSVHAGYAVACEIIRAVANETFLSSVLVDFENTRNTLTVRRMHYGFYEAPEKSGAKKYKSYRIEMDNARLQAEMASTAVLSSRQIAEFAAFDPDFFPPQPLPLEVVKIDLEQVVQLAFQEPPYFTLSQLDHLGYMEVSLCSPQGEPRWRVLCEHNQAGFRTIHLDAKTGAIVVHTLDRLAGS